MADPSPRAASSMLIDLQGYQAGPVGRFATKLFTLAGHNPLPATAHPMPANAGPIIRELYQGTPPAGSASGEPVRVTVETEPRIAFVGFSGGKDSTAVAIKMIQAGYRVTLFYVKGINPAYPEEQKAAEATATALGCRLAVMRVKLGRQEWLESPAKNQVILGLMIDAGIKTAGAGTYAMGVMYTEEARDVAFDSGYSDAIEMQRAAKEVYETMAPGIDIQTELLKNEADSYRTILGHNPALIGTIQSCMTPIRFRGVHHKRNRAKFGAAIQDNRCGSCYKCAQEILILDALGALPVSADARKHAEDLLVKHAYKTIGPHARSMTRDQVISYFAQDVR